MSITAGADPDELDRLAVRLAAASTSVVAVRTSLTPQINASPWHGRNADRFRQQWSAEHRRAIAEAAAFLEDGAKRLRADAQQQRDASRDVGSGRDLIALYLGPQHDDGTAGDDERASTEDLDPIEELLEGLGLPAAAIGAVLDLLGSSKAVAAYFKGIADNEAFAAFIRGSSTFLDVGSMLVDLVTDMSEHAGQMPLDELLFHGVVETTLRFAADKGIDAGMDWAAKVVTPMIVGVVIPGLGAPIGVALSPAVGFLLKQTLGEMARFGLDQIDQHTDVFDAAADAGLEGYRAVKDGAAMLADGVEYVRDVGSDVIDGAQNLADGIGGAIDRGGDAIGDGWNALTGWPR